ncbi:MAG: hypothetical protein ABI766_13615 [Gemmatimonadales bacterium]
MTTRTAASHRFPHTLSVSAHRVFLLSPAFAGGKRARLLMREEAMFPLAQRLRSAGDVTLGEAFSFLSGLYFRGKFAYAERFARVPPGVAGSQVITTNRGLVPVGTTIGLDDLRNFGTVAIEPADPRYRLPLERDLAALSAGNDLEVILLGSVATGKYVDVLLEALGERLRFPVEFTGRGDMSRGAMMLRAVREGVELEYQPVRGAVRRGARPRKIGATE